MCQRLDLCIFIHRYKTVHLRYHFHSCITIVVLFNRTQHGLNKLLSLTYKVLTTNQPPYLHHLISVQPPRSTHSSSLVTLARPPTSSCLRITDRSFRYASPCLWNQLPSSFRQPHSSPSVSDFPVHAPATILLSQLTTLTIHNSISL